MAEKEITIHLCVKVPKLRIWTSRVIVWMLSLCVKSENAQVKICDALSSWVVSGARVYADGKLVR